MVTAGRRPKEDLKQYLPLIIKKIGQTRPIDIKRYIDLRVKPQTGFTSSYNSITKYCELLSDEGIQAKQVVLSNIKNKNKRIWEVTYYKSIPDQEVVIIEKH